NVRGVMLILRLVMWLIAIQFGLAAFASLIAGLGGSMGDGIEGVFAIILGVICVVISGVIIKVATTVFGEQGEASTPLK
ncbi:hypothetical protein OAR33_00615, partial [bacterium]|nr:hypothetical protein [bacterium]